MSRELLNEVIEEPCLRRIRESVASAVFTAFASNSDMARQGDIATLADAGFVKEGTEREKFLIDGHRIDVDTYGRLRSDPAPKFDRIPMLEEKYPVPHACL